MRMKLLLSIPPQKFCHFEIFNRYFQILNAQRQYHHFPLSQIYPIITIMQEWQIQAYVSTELKRRGILHHGDQNAGKRGPQAAARAKATGLCAGWPDMCIIPEENKIIFVEFKVTDGEQSKAQKEVQSHMALLDIPYYVVMANNGEEAWEQVRRLINVD